MDLPAHPPERYVGDRDLTHWYTPVGRWLERRMKDISHLNGSYLVLVVTALIGGIAVIALADAAAEVYEGLTEGDGVAGLDQPLLAWIVAHRNPELNAVVTVFTTSGGPVWMPVITTVVTLLVARRLRSWTPVLLMVLAVAGSLLMTTVGKAAVGRHRPPLAEAIPPYESSASFPSGHSLNSMVIAGLLVYFTLTIVSRLAARVAVVIGGVTYVIAMGLSRVYLGHHWLSDVVGAWAIGLCWVALLVTAHRLTLTHHRMVEQRRQQTVPAVSG